MMITLNIFSVIAVENLKLVEESNASGVVKALDRKALSDWHLTGRCCRNSWSPHFKHRAESNFHTVE